MKVGQRRRITGTMHRGTERKEAAFDIGDEIVIVSIDPGREEVHATDARHSHHLFTFDAIERLTVPLPGHRGLQ